MVGKDSGRAVGNAHKAARALRWVFQPSVVAGLLSVLIAQRKEARRYSSKEEDDFKSRFFDVKPNAQQSRPYSVLPHQNSHLSASGIPNEK